MRIALLLSEVINVSAYLLFIFYHKSYKKNYIFCSYFGQKSVRENRRNITVHNILVFDHNGHFLANLHTDRSASRLSVSDDEKTIYAVTEEPEIAIVRFDISNILK